MSLPPLPPPDRISVYGDAHYSDEAMLAYAAAAVAAEREAAAKVCESQNTYGDQIGGWLEILAAAIRARTT